MRLREDLNQKLKMFSVWKVFGQRMLSELLHLMCIMNGGLGTDPRIVFFRKNSYFMQFRWPFARFQSHLEN